MEILPSFETQLSLFVFCFFAFCALIQLVFTFYFFSRLAFTSFKKKNIKNTEKPPISIIIAARNDSDNLFANLPLILEQHYPNFEVIVVNHQSIDESYHIINAYKMKYPHLRMIEVERSKHIGVGKKLPLTLGIKSALHENLLFTDADCQPESNLWLQGMVDGFANNTQIVLGYGPYKEEEGFLNKVIRFDTIFIAMNYFSFAMAKMPYMGVGRNLAYTKTAFKSVSGFKSHYSISSGDDDLFVQEAAKLNSYSIQLNPETHCYSTPKNSWKSWIDQKSRHYSTAGKYQVIKKALLGIYPLSLILLWFSFVILLLDKEYTLFTGFIFTGVIALKWFVQGRCFSKLKGKKFILSLPFFELFYALLQPILYYTSEKPRISKWK
jgi:cellulose synthase/poly-beta-1,6-N-acetylglucosamine synthase-like glycosyltransferase